MTPAAVILLVLGILWLVSVIPWPQAPPPWAGGIVAFLFCVVLALHVFRFAGL